MNGARIPRLMSIFIIILLIFTSCTHVFIAMGDVENDTRGSGSPQVELDPGRGQEQESEDNGLSGSADEFAGGTPGDPLLVNGTLSTDADIDWFKITVAGTDPGILNVSLTAPLNNSVVPEYEFTVYEQNDDTASKSYIYGIDSGWQNADPTMVTSWAAGPGYYFVRVKVKDLTTVVTGDDYQFNFTYTAVPSMNIESELLDKVDANDEFGDADAMNLTGYPVKEVNFFGTIRSDTDHDWFKLNITGDSAGMLNISFTTFYRDSTGTHNSQKLKFTLYGPLPSGTETEDIMLYGEDTGTAGATLVQGSMVPPGDYLLEVLDEIGTGYSKYEPYHLYINYTPVWNEDPGIQLESELTDGGGNNDNSTSTSLMVLAEDAGKYNGTIFGNIDSTLDQDWFNFTLPGSIVGDLTLTFDTPYVVVNPTYWYVLYRTDRMGTEFLNTSGVGSTSPSFQDTLNAVREGEYYIKVMAATVPQSAVIRAEPYSLHISFEPNDDLPVEVEHATGRDNNEPDNAENITMLPPGDGRPHHLGEMYGTVDSAGDADYYIFNFTDDYVGTLTIYVQSPNYVPNTFYHYNIYGPDSATYQCAYIDNYGITGEQSVTIPGGLPGTYYLKVYTDAVFDMAHLYYVMITFEPEDTSTYQVAGKIAGSVLNNFTSQGIPNVQVEIWNGDDTEQWGEFTSDASGDYVTSSLPKQDIWINVDTNGYAPYSHMTTMTLGADQDIDIRLDPTFGNLEGKVYWGASANANRLIPNATVEIAGTTFSTLTDAAGEYSFTNVPTGTYNVKFSKEDYLSDTKSVQILESQTAPLDGYLTKITGNIIVFLRDGEGVVITQKATVTLDRDDMGPVTLSLGTWLPNNYTYGASNLLIGNYTLTATHQDYATIAMNVRVLSDRYVWINLTMTNRRFIVLIHDNNTGSTILSSNQFYVKLYTLSKSGVDPEDSTALAAALVSTATQLYDNLYEFYNGSYGYYWRFYNVENGDYLLNVTHVRWSVGNPSNTYMAYEIGVTVDDSDLVLDVNVTKPGMKLRIIDEDTNASVTYATVKLKYNLDNKEYTINYDDNTDSYNLEAQLGYGSYTLTVDHGDFKSVTKIIDITEPYTFLEVFVHQGRLKMTVEGGDEIYMHQENRVIVFVSDAETDEPMSGAAITVSTGVFGSPSTGVEGRVEITVSPTNPAITEITFTATYTGYASKSQEFSIITGEEPTTGRITGTVKYDNSYGAAVKKKEVDLYLGIPDSVIVGRTEPSHIKTTTTDDAGFFSFGNLSFDWYVISVGSYQDLRMSDDWASQYNSIEINLQNRFQTKEIYVTNNNPPIFKPRSKEDFANNANPNDQYKGKVYSEHVLDNDRGDVFRIFVADADGDEPEYVRLNINGKSYELKALKKTNPDYTGDNVDDVLPRMEDGRYYEVAVKNLKSGKYNYTFSTRDLWSAREVVKESDGKVEITSLREMLFRDNMKSLGILGVLCVILLIIFLIANKKAKKYFTENTNKELTLNGLDYALKELEIGASGDMVGDLNNLRREYLEGKVDSEEFIKRLK